MARRSEYRGTDRSRAPRGRKVTVKEENTLLPFLFGLLNEQSKSSVKALLAHGQISVNGTVTSQFNTPLTPGDEKSGMNFSEYVAVLSGNTDLLDKEIGRAHV